jgi:hypothetical protein
MFATTLTHEGEGPDEESLAHPNALETIRERIEELDGVDRTLVTIGRDEAHLAVGGGAASGFVVYATYDNDIFHQLADEEASADDSVTIVAGGQAGEYPRQQVVTMDAALRAAETFATAGELAPDLTWVQT